MKGVWLCTYRCLVEFRLARSMVCGRQRVLLGATLLVDGAHVAKMSSFKNTIHVDNRCITFEYSVYTDSRG